jgi:hypothetical protein
MDEAHGLAPSDDQITLWAALFLAAAGRLEEGRRLFAEATASEPRGGEHLRRFVAAGQLPDAVAPLIEALTAS